MKDTLSLGKYVVKIINTEKHLYKVIIYKNNIVQLTLYPCTHYKNAFRDAIWMVNYLEKK